MSGKKIELITKKNNSLEITEEALNFLLSLKTKNLSIISLTGPSHNSLFNDIISNNSERKNEDNIYIWNKPLDLNENDKLIIFDYTGKKNDNLFLLNILISNYCLYNINGDLKEEIINNCVNDMNIKDLINFKNNIYMPHVFFVNDNKSEEEIKDILEKNSEFKNIDLNNGIYKSINYIIRKRNKSYFKQKQ